MQLLTAATCLLTCEKSEVPVLNVHVILLAEDRGSGWVGNVRLNEYAKYISSSKVIVQTYTHRTDSSSRTNVCRQRGGMVSGVRRMNEVNARRARLVFRRVTVFRRVYHLGM